MLNTGGDAAKDADGRALDAVEDAADQDAAELLAATEVTSLLHPNCHPAVCACIVTHGK